MRPTFRAKLTAIVGIAALAFVAILVTSALTATQVERQLAVVQQRYVPKIELGPKLEAQLEHVSRSVQDAVAAQDSESLAETRTFKNEFLAQVTAARGVVPAADADALNSAMEDYYAATFDVSRRLLAGETGERLVDAMAAMQGKHAHMQEVLKKATAFDHRELAEAFIAATKAEATATRVQLTVGAGCLALVLMLSLWLSRGVFRSLAVLDAGLDRFGRGEFSEPIAVMARDELGELAQQANRMALSLQRLNQERDREDWLRAGRAGLNHELRGELEPHDVARRAVRFLARYVEAPSAVLYYVEADGVLHALGQYAASLAESETGATPSFRRGEGLLGQAALDNEIAIITELPNDYMRVRSGLGEGRPSALVLLPLEHLGRVNGVLELAVFKPWSEDSTELLKSVRETLAIAIEVARARAALRDLLAETQRQAQRLEAQEDELRANNEELQAQQEELRESNQELTQQTEELEAQRLALEQKNGELDEARKHLEQKAGELTTVSAYKSQFLANMSHELRTPLNSMLLLSDLLASNDGRNLTDKQVEFCKTIHTAGKDLLALINQVLDLAKIESGKQELTIGPMLICDLAAHAERLFRPLARDKGLEFNVVVAGELPETIASDARRVEQVLNNLLGNAIKFTEHGTIGLEIGRVPSGTRFERADLQAEKAWMLAISDTGIGIAAEHQEGVFAPFEQVEALPDRRYGGTGLGLSIARAQTELLGGELRLRSEPGHGSTFTCYLPLQPPAAGARTSVARAADAHPPIGAAYRPAGDTRATPAGATIDDVHLLVIEDDPVFAEVLGDVIRGQGLKHLVAADGQTGLRIARERRPSGIILDLKLTDVDGWTVMEALRANPVTAAIPIHIVSATEAGERGLALGAIGYLTKPATRDQLVRVVEALVHKTTAQKCRVLIVEDDVAAAMSLVEQLRECDIEACGVTSAQDALVALSNEHFSCMVLDLGLPDMDGLQFLESLGARGGAETPPVVVYTGRALSKAETQRLEAYTEAVVLKDGHGAERLLDEIRLFARRLKEDLPAHRAARMPVASNQPQLSGRKVLVVDDDMRTVYALSALLRAKGAEVHVADTGCAALSVLAAHPDLEIVLMDIMMPEMDGYEAMRRIRQDARFATLPVIALTAKAMKDDRERCIEAGASDYLPKPVDANRLMAILHTRLWKSASDGAGQRD